MRVVFDISVFVSVAASLTGPSRRCFYLLARRHFQLAVTGEILAEYEFAATRLSLTPGKNYGMKWLPLFNWVRTRALLCEAPPLGKQRSRDVKDDIFPACALAGGAKFIISHDKDLLDLEKPFGIEILKPAVFVARFR